MRGNDKLAAVKPRGILNEFRQLLLQFGGQAVFRLVEQVKRIFADAVRKIGERAFPVGSGVQAFGQPARDVRRFGAALALVEALERVVILQRAQRNGFCFLRPVVFLKQRLAAPVHAGVDRAQVQQEIEHVVAGDDGAAHRHPARRRRHIRAERKIILEQRRVVEGRAPFQRQLFRDDVQQRRFAGAVAAVQEGDLLKTKRAQLLLGKNFEGIGAVRIALHFQLGRIGKHKARLLVRRGQRERIQIFQPFHLPSPLL